jgi:hypothetical protein
VGKYGEAAVKAVKLIASEVVCDPSKAWENASSQVFGPATSSQGKSCPRCTFLGLCEEGKIRGVPPINYGKSKKNKGYALIGLLMLSKRPELASNPKKLWEAVMEECIKNKMLEKAIAYNQQMDVVTSLWNHKLFTD